MSIDTDINRPLTTTTEVETIELEAVVNEDGTNGLFSLDLKENIGLNDRLVARLNVTPVFNGVNLTLSVQVLDFLGQAANTYADTKVSPFLDTDADSASKAVSVGSINMDIFHTAAGNPTAS